MVDSLRQKVKNFFESCVKVEAELKKYKQQVMESVGIAKRKLRLNVYLICVRNQWPKHLVNTNSSTISQIKLQTPKPSNLFWRCGWVTRLWKTTKFWKKLVTTSRVFLKRKVPLRLPLKPHQRPSLLRLPKHLLLEFPRHPASDSGNFSLQDTNAKRLRVRTKVFCVWLKRSKKLTCSGSREARSWLAVAQARRRANEKRTSVDVCWIGRR